MYKVGSLFTGIGGFDLGFEQAGYRVVWQCDNNKQCKQLLRAKWPNVTYYDSVQEVLTHDVEPVDVICGGDPCPKHSRARGSRPSKHPDLSGYFLAVVGRLRPRWVVRENVPSPSVDDFCAGLEALAYRTIVVRMDARGLTCQSRKRDFVVGTTQKTRKSLGEIFSLPEGYYRHYKTTLGATQIAPCLTANARRYSTADCYIWERQRGVRILDCEERERLAGFPVGWTEGFFDAARARMTGNAVVPGLAEYLANAIREAMEQCTQI